MLKNLREPVNGLTHFFTAIVAIAGLVALLIIGRGNLAGNLRCFRNIFVFRQRHLSYGQGQTRGY